MISSVAIMNATFRSRYLHRREWNRIVWDTQTGESLIVLQHQHIVRAVCFPDSSGSQTGSGARVLATGGAEKKLRLFDLSIASSSSAASDAKANGTDSAVSGALAGPAATGTSKDDGVQEIGAGEHTATIKSIVWASDSHNVLISAADDRKLRWWDIRCQSPVGQYTVDGPIGSCELNRPVDASPDASTNGDDANSPAVRGSSGAGSSGAVLSVAAGKSVYFFDGRQPSALLKQVNLGTETASVALHTGLNRFITGSTENTWVKVWDYDTEAELEMGKGHHGPIWSLCFSPDGKLYATGSEDGTVKLWKFTSEPYGLWK